MAGVEPLSALELIFDYFEDHVRAASAIEQRRPVALGVIGFLVGAVSLFVSQALAQRLTLLSFSYTSCLLVVVGRLAAGFALAAVVHLILEMGGVRGSAASLFVQLGLADLAWAVAVPLVILLRLVYPGSTWPATGLFAVLWLLTLSLKARGLTDTYHVSTGRAWITLILPYAAVVVASLLMLSLAAVELAVQLFKAFR